MEIREGGALLVPDGLPLAVAPPPLQADSDETLLRLWLHGRSPRTRRAYAADVAVFRALLGKPLRQITLGDMQAYKDALASGAAGGRPLSSASQARKLSAVKSLLSFGQELGYLPFNVGTPVRLPAVRQVLAERILAEDAVQRLLHLEPTLRNRAVLRLLYYGGLRISEVCALRARDLQPRDDAGQVSVFGKGGRTRVVLLKPSVWQELAPLIAGAAADRPVFCSRTRRLKGAPPGDRPLDPSQVHRIVKAAAARAGLSNRVSAHWLRHAHVSHALDRGAPAHLVQATVGHASLATTSRYAHARPSDSSARYLPG